MEIVCVNCGKTFAFTESERAFYDSKGFSPPKRCFNCRQKRKQQRQEEERRGGEWR